jgi:hypothetical protein
VNRHDTRKDRFDTAGFDAADCSAAGPQAAR